MVGRTGVDIRKRTVGKNSLSGFGPITLMKRPVRTHMLGVVGAGGVKPPTTRLAPSYESEDSWLSIYLARFIDSVVNRVRPNNESDSIHIEVKIESRAFLSEYCVCKIFST